MLGGAKDGFSCLNSHPNHHLIIIHTILTLIVCLSPGKLDFRLKIEVIG